MRELGVAPIAPKNRKRSAPAASAWRSRRAVATPFSSSMLPAGWSRIVAARCTTSRAPAHQLAQRDRVREVPERDLHPHAVGPEPARIPHQDPDLLALGQQAPQQRRAHHARGSRQNDHLAIIRFM